MVLVSTQLGPLVPAALHPLLDSSLGRFLLALVVEHILIAAKVVLSAAIDDVPPEIVRGGKGGREGGKKGRREGGGILAQ
jgi:hypothetical protein